MQRAEQVLARLAAGDTSAFAEIVREHQSMVFSLAYHFLRNRSLAEEMAQDVFMSLYRNISTIESPAHLKFWLRQVTSRRCIDHARRQRLRRQVSLEEIPEPASPVPLPDPALRHRLDRLVASLPDKPRMILVLRYQEDLEPSEIARVLEIPLNTVKSNLRRSLALLREKLNRRVGELSA